jgi:hypothetical protein
VIDPDDPKNNVVEVMLCVQRVRGSQIVDVAGPAIFIEGNQAFAGDLQRRLLALITDPELSRRCEDPDELCNLLSEVPPK